MKNRLTAADIEDAISKVEYIRVGSTTTTICALTLRNGFVVIGKSACIDPATFDPILGDQIAYEDAFGKVWELEGYALATRRYITSEVDKALQGVSNSIEGEV